MNMPKSYSEDLRWRAVWLHIAQGMSYKEISRLLYMSERSVQRYMELFHTTGTVAAVVQKRGPDKILSDFEQFTVLQTLIHKPTSYLHEVQAQLFDVTGAWVHESTICRMIKEQGFTRKRVCRIALQQSEQLRLQFMAEISMYDPDMLIWIDETGSAQRNNIRQYGYSLRGMPARVHQLQVGGRRLSAIPVLTTSGIADVYITSDSVDGTKFEEFLFQCLFPIILPFDGINHHSVIVMDNASIHHLERVHDLITGIGAKLIFLPPYSPDLMPLEEVFSKVKAVLKANDNLYLTTSTPELMIKLAFATVTPQDALGYIKHAGYIF